MTETIDETAAQELAKKVLEWEAMRDMEFCRPGFGIKGPPNPEANAAWEHRRNRLWQQIVELAKQIQQ